MTHGDTAVQQDSKWVTGTVCKYSSLSAVWPILYCIYIHNCGVSVLNSYPCSLVLFLSGQRFNLCDLSLVRVIGITPFLTFYADSWPSFCCVAIAFLPRSAKTHSSLQMLNRYLLNKWANEYMHAYSQHTSIQWYLWIRLTSVYKVNRPWNWI